MLYLFPSLTTVETHAAANSTYKGRISSGQTLTFMSSLLSNPANYLWPQQMIARVQPIDFGWVDRISILNSLRSSPPPTTMASHGAKKAGQSCVVRESRESLEPGALLAQQHFM